MIFRLLVLLACLASAAAFVPAAGTQLTASRVAASSVEIALSKTQQRFNTQLAARKKTGAQYAAKRGARIVAGKGVEKVRFPVDGGPDRAAAGQAGGPFL